MNNEADPNYDFLHFLHDVVVLLGGRKDVCDLIDKAKDGVTKEDVTTVRNYACELMNSVKGSLNDIHKMQIQVAGDEPTPTKE